MTDFLDSVIDLSKELALEAGKIQLEHLGHVERIEYKGAINIVTEVDRQCEALIVNGIIEQFPDHDILAEEGTGDRRASEYRWIIDPLDGTVNFAHDFPVFCVSIALEKKGEIVAGVIYDPNRDELFSARKGRGAYLGNQRMKVSEAASLKKSLLATGFGYNIQEEGELNNFNHFYNFINSAQAVRRLGSAAIDLAWVACGRLEGFWELFLWPWDMAAGVIILREAGGMVTSFDGGTYDLYGTEILASNSHIHGEMIEVLKQGESNA